MLAIVDEEIRIGAVWCGVFAGVCMRSPLWHLASGFEFSRRQIGRWEIRKKAGLLLRIYVSVLLCYGDDNSRILFMDLKPESR